MLKRGDLGGVGVGGAVVAEGGDAAERVFLGDLLEEGRAVAASFLVGVYEGVRGRGDVCAIDGAFGVPLA